MAYLSKQLENVSESDSELASGTVTPEAELKRPVDMNAVNEALTTQANKEVNLSIHRSRGFAQSDSSILSTSNVPCQRKAGVWYCCQCGGLGNALSPERCPLCPHFRCPYCRAA